jgi:hypothetical protein
MKTDFGGRTGAGSNHMRGNWKLEVKIFTALVLRVHNTSIKAVGTFSSYSFYFYHTHA